VPALADTTIRLLGQEPLAGRVPTAELLRLAEILDGAGFAYLEVSGGGCFDAAVKRGVESPWERIRAIKARTKTPLGLALRGKFLVGDRPVDNDFARRFVASAAANGIDVFRLHDPLNDVSNLRGAAEAIAEAGRELEAGLVYSAGRSGETNVLVEQARRLPELGASRVLLHDPTGALLPHQSYELTERFAEATGLPVGIYCQGCVGSGAVDDSRGRARRRRPAGLHAVPARAHTPSGQRAGSRRDAGRPGPRPRHRRPRALARLGHRRRAHRRRARDTARAADRRPGRGARASAWPRRRAGYPPPRVRSGRSAGRRARGAGADPRGGRRSAARGADRADARVAGTAARPLRPALDDRHGRVACADPRPLRHRPGTRRRHGAAGRVAQHRPGDGRDDRAAARGAARRGGRPRHEARRSCSCSGSSARTRRHSCTGSAAAAPRRDSRAAASSAPGRTGSARSSASSRSRASAR